MELSGSNLELRTSLFQGLENTIDKIKPKDFDSHPLGLIQIDLRGAIQAWNRTIENWSGLRVFDMVGKNFFIHVLKDSTSNLYQIFQKGVTHKNGSEIFDFQFIFPAQMIYSTVYFFFSPSSFTFWLAIQKK
jgi:photoactive yellow protein